MIRPVRNIGDIVLLFCIFIRVILTSKIIQIDKTSVFKIDNWYVFLIDSGKVFGIDNRYENPPKRSAGAAGLTTVFAKNKPAAK